MTTQLPQSPSKTISLYEQDFLLWLEITAKQLQEGNLEHLDRKNLLEEIEAMGRKEKLSLESNLEILLMHLLKYKYQANKRSNSWQYTIDEHRSRIRKAFKVSPSLKQYFEEIFFQCYLEGRRKAALETGLSLATFPPECPFSQEETLNSDYFPD
jgi:hypothetical protein